MLLIITFICVLSLTASESHVAFETEFKSNPISCNELLCDLSMSFNIDRWSLADIAQEYYIKSHEKIIFIEKLKESFIWPVDTDERTISSYYGERSYQYNDMMVKDFHQGVDIAAPFKNSVLAVEQGIVIKAEYSESYGNYIIIDHGYGIASLYAHCEKLLVNQEELVIQGQPIAEVGATGWATGPHLHFEVLVDNEQKDVLSDGWLAMN